MLDPALDRLSAGYAEAQDLDMKAKIALNIVFLSVWLVPRRLPMRVPRRLDSGGA